jgi:hypothetical protein
MVISGGSSYEKDKCYEIPALMFGMSRDEMS